MGIRVGEPGKDRSLSIIFYISKNDAFSTEIQDSLSRELTRWPRLRHNRDAVRLGVNVDHIATLRQARGGREPDPVTAALLAEQAGADGIVVHLREDRRHIQDRDVRLLRELVQTHLNLEMAPTEEMVAIALEIRPDQVTLVPERRQELTTEGGLDVEKVEEPLREILGRLREAGIRVSLFIDPDLDQVEAADRCGADMIELHTGRYAEARGEGQRAAELAALQEAAQRARVLDLRVAAGHGLNYQNVIPVAAIPEVEELNIGHSIVARAAFVGIGAAVREMKALIHRARLR